MKNVSKRNTFTLVLKVFLFFILLQSTALSASLGCYELFVSTEQKFATSSLGEARLQKIENSSGPRLSYSASLQAQENPSSYVFMSYNIFNLYTSVPFSNNNNAVRVERERRLGNAAIIRESNPDFIYLMEVESIEALDRFIAYHLNNDYVGLLIPGNDGRGIDVAFLIRKSLRTANIANTTNGVIGHALQI